MLVINSVRLEASVQIDGRTIVRERHTSDAGDSQDREYMVDAGQNLDATMAANAQVFLAQLAMR